MLYEHRLTAPANTASGDPVKLPVTLVPGTIVGLAVQFPAGCMGLVHAQIWRGAHILWPSNPDSGLAANAWVVEWQEDYRMDAAPYQLVLVGWSDDDTFDHTLTFRLNLIEQKRVEEAGGMGLLRRIAAVLGVR